MADQIRACTRAASSLGYDLKKIIGYAKKQDFTGVVTGLLMVTQEVGALETCGFTLKKEHLLNALISLCPRDWDVIERELTAFGEHAYQQIAGPAS